MKLKLSTLAVIVAIIFLFYYYSIYVPSQPISASMSVNDEESTRETMLEGFEVTPIDDDYIQNY